MLAVRVTDLMGEYKSWYEIINFFSYWFGLVFITIFTSIKRKEVFEKTNYVWNFFKCFGILSAFYFAMCKMIKVFGAWFNNGHSDFFGGMYTAFILIPIACMVFLAKPMKTTDYFAPLIAFILIFFKIACYCAGCCFGKRWTYGLYSYVHNRFEYPTALIETAFAVIICAVLVWYVSSKKYKVGTGGPLFMVLYSGTRFLVEFVRDDFPAIAGPFNINHFQCVAGVLIGLILYEVMVNIGEKIDEKFDKKVKPLREKIYKKFKFILNKNEKELRSAISSN